MGTFVKNTFVVFCFFALLGLTVILAIMDFVIKQVALLCVFQQRIAKIFRGIRKRPEKFEPFLSSFRSFFFVFFGGFLFAIIDKIIPRNDLSTNDEVVQSLMFLREKDRQISDAVDRDIDEPDDIPHDRTLECDRFACIAADDDEPKDSLPQGRLMFS